MTPHPHSRRDLLLALRGAGGGETAPFVSATESYFCYRAPAIAVTQRGSILVFSEGRVHHQRDEGDIDLVLKRSTDGGRTWSKQVVLENDGANPCKNPAPVVLPNGRVLLLWLWNKSIASEKDRTTREVYVTFSDDDGVTWSKSRNISSSVYGKDWRWYGIGPGHGIVKTRGPHGRIVIPARFSSWKTCMISVDVTVSRFPVGSSARRMEGSLMSARAIATRCCSPPESLFGVWCERSASPTLSRASRARATISRPLNEE